MYKFRDTNSDWHFHEHVLPSFAMRFNGEYIEDLVEGYRTLSVAGRESQNYALENQDTCIGSITVSKRLLARTITIKFMLDADSSIEFQERFKRLLSVLDCGIVPISFNDEPDWTYYGEYDQMDEVPSDSNHIISSYTIYCADPIRYHKPVTVGAGEINQLGKLQPLEMEFTVLQGASYFISNGKQMIKGTNGSATPRRYKLDFRDCSTYIDGIEDPKAVALDSDFENFEISHGMDITTDAINFLLTYTEVA